MLLFRYKCGDALPFWGKIRAEVEMAGQTEGEFNSKGAVGGKWHHLGLCYQPGLSECLPFPPGQSYSVGITFHGLGFIAILFFLNSNMHVQGWHVYISIELIHFITGYP